MAHDKLNAKQAAFVDEYLVDLNATQAAIRAGCSAITASQAGERLLRNVEIQTAITKRMNDREKRTEITQDRVIKEMARVAFGDPRRVMSWRPGGAHKGGNYRRNTRGHVMGLV